LDSQADTLGNAELSRNGLAARETGKRMADDVGLLEILSSATGESRVTHHWIALSVCNSDAASAIAW
jgi:hypothetical protein